MLIMHCESLLFNGLSMFMETISVGVRVFPCTWIAAFELVLQSIAENCFLACFFQGAWILHGFNRLSLTTDQFYEVLTVKLQESLKKRLCFFNLMDFCHVFHITSLTSFKTLDHNACRPRACCHPGELKQKNYKNEDTNDVTLNAAHLNFFQA